MSIVKGPHNRLRTQNSFDAPTVTVVFLLISYFFLTTRECFALDSLAQAQSDAIANRYCSWGYWGTEQSQYSGWTEHSNRLVPAYIFGGTLKEYSNEKSLYRNKERLQKLYGRAPLSTLNKVASYGDQTDIYKLQREAIEIGKKKYVFLVVFDGLDWQTTRTTALYKSKKISYNKGKGTGLLFQDYRIKKCSTCQSDFGYVVTSPYGDSVRLDVDSQIYTSPPSKFGGYDATLGGSFPWSNEISARYMIGRSSEVPHAVTDSAASITSLTSGFKVLNGSLNITPSLQPLETVTRWAQRTKGFKVGVVTSVPISHATPAGAYAMNVSRDDYQDLTRDMLGLPSISRPLTPDPGLDVILGGGFGENVATDRDQGGNFIPGNRYLSEADKNSVDITKNPASGKYIVVERTSSQPGAEILKSGALEAARGGHKLLGLFGMPNGHLPYRTADGDFHPVNGVKNAEIYSKDDIRENPTLAELTDAALSVLERSNSGFWLLVEAGDVDWGSHENNIDNVIGAVSSGEEALKRVFAWIEQKAAWKDSLVVVTSDHGHMFHLKDAEVFVELSRQISAKGIKN